MVVEQPPSVSMSSIPAPPPGEFLEGVGWGRSVVVRADVLEHFNLPRTVFFFFCFFGWWWLAKMRDGNCATRYGSMFKGVPAPDHRDAGSKNGKAAAEKEAGA